jgi:type IV pilus assembly protein PilA
MYQKPSAGTRQGFTLVELAVVIVIIGVLAAFGVPRFLKSVERSKAAEAFQFLAAVRSAQERYIAQQGVYASDLNNLDITQSTPKYFTVGTMSVTPASDGTSSWSLTMTRIAATSSYGDYTVIFTRDGYDPSSSISDFPEINPLGTSSGS